MRKAGLILSFNLVCGRILGMQDFLSPLGIVAHLGWGSLPDLLSFMACTE